MTPELFWTGFEAIATGVAAVATVGAAYVAVVTLRALKADSQDRSRPIVLAELMIDPVINDRLNLVIRNAGASAARDVRITFDPARLVIAGDERPALHTGSINERYAGPIPLLAPDTRLSNSYFTLHPEKGGNAYPLPDQLTVDVRYTDGERRHVYADAFELDVTLLGHETYGRSSSEPQKRIAAAVESVARGVGRA